MPESGRLPGVQQQPAPPGDRAQAAPRGVVESGERLRHLSRERRKAAALGAARTDGAHAQEGAEERALELALGESGSERRRASAHRPHRKREQGAPGEHPGAGEHERQDLARLVPEVEAQAARRGGEREQEPDGAGVGDGAGRVVARGRDPAPRARPQARHGAGARGGDLEIHQHALAQAQRRRRQRHRERRLLPPAADPQRERRVAARRERERGSLLRRAADGGVEVGAAPGVEALHAELRVGGRELRERTLQGELRAGAQQEARAGRGDRDLEAERLAPRERGEEVPRAALALLEPPRRHDLGEQAPARASSGGAGDGAVPAARSRESPDHAAALRTTRATARAGSAIARPASAPAIAGAAASGRRGDPPDVIAPPPSPSPAPSRRVATARARRYGASVRSAGQREVQRNSRIGPGGPARVQDRSRCAERVRIRALVGRRRRVDTLTRPRASVRLYGGADTGRRTRGAAPLGQRER